MPPDERRRQLAGSGFVLVSAILMSFGGLLIKLLPWSPFSINGGRNLLAVPVSLVYIKMSKQKIVINKSVIMGAVAYAATGQLFVYANKLTTAANAILLQYVAPVFIILLLWIFWKRKPRKLDVFSAAIILLGVFCFFMDSLEGGAMLGNMLALASAVSYALVYMMRLFPGASPASSFLLGQAINGLIGLPFIVRESDFSALVLPLILLMGLLQQGLAFVLFSEGLIRTQPIAASLIATIEPILNPIWVALLYREKMGVGAMVGGLIVLFAVTAYNWLSWRFSRRQSVNSL